ncbi:hypothetical protein IU449_27505 [Nocardia higoensis]|uniref:Secreted protein n=1 Tax=Nocardia higoensis TaxID=228599 RepID=A0ABS0DK14_9NOCA|nr:hypothetical protein [Nocardia higoensis]MBF6358248.1 hypothetical protein [Nocardia higoensis]
MVRTVKAAVGAVMLGALLIAPAAVAGTATATTMNCVYTGPIVGHPGMQYVCYVIHDDNSRETFYAPGPAGRL